MSIQQSLNQALGIGAVLATQTGAYAKRKEAAIKEQAISSDKQRLEALEKTGYAQPFTVGKSQDIVSKELHAETYKQAQELRRRIMEQEPTWENVEKYVGSMSPDEIRIRQANRAAAMRVQTKKIQKEMIKNGNK